MANSSNQSNDSLPKQSRRLWLSLLSRPTIGLLLVLLAVLAGVSWRAWTFVWEELPAVVEKNLSQTLNRPVQLGQVQGVSLTSLRFGPSAIPTFTKQVGSKRIQDLDRVTVKAVDVVFNPLDLLLERTLKLDITLDQPDLYLDQAQDGRWISTPITTRESEGPIETKLQAVRFRQAKVVVVPQGTSPRALRSVNGRVLFTQQNQRLQFDVAGQFAPGGTLDVQGQWLRPTQQVILTAQGQDLPAVEVAGLIRLPAEVKAGRINGKVKIQFQPNQPLAVEGTARVRSASVVVPDQYLLRSRRPTPRSFRAVHGTVQLADRSQKIRFDLQGQVVAGGKFTVKGQWLRPTQQINLALRAQDLAAKVLDRPFKLPISASTGKIDGNLRVQLRPNQPPNLQGTAQLKDVTGRISQLPTPLTNTTGQLRFQGLTTTLENLRGIYGKIPVQASGTIDPKRGYNLAGRTEQVTVASVRDTFNLNLPFPTAGSVQGQNLQLTGPLSQPLVTGIITDAPTVQVDQVEFQDLLARFELKAPVLKFTQIRAVPTTGGIVTGNARLNVLTRDNLVFNLQARQVPGDAIAQRYGVSPAVKIGTVSATAQISGPPSNLRTAVQFQAPEATYPGSGSVLVSGGQTLLRNIHLRVAGGRVNVDGRLANGQLQAAVAGAGVQLQRFSPNLRGLFRGRLNVSAPLASLKPETVRAQGQVHFSEGLSVIQEPLTAQVRWDGEKILVQRATAPGFTASGAVFAKLQGPQAPRITALNLNVQTEDYSLQNLPLRQVPGTQLVGRADFAGRLTGTAAAPDLRGSLRVNDLALNQVDFEPTLAGKLGYQANQGLDLQLSGIRDRVNLALGPNLRPESFFVQRDKATAVGQTQGDRLLVNLQRFPLTALNLTPRGLNLGPVAGLVSGDFDVNLQTFTGEGDVAIAQPRIGGFTGETFTGRLQYENGVATLNNGVLRQAGSQYDVAGTFTPGPDPQFTAQLKLAQAEVQDILTAFNWFNLGDVQRGLRQPSYGKAADVQTTGIETSEAPLLTQLRRLSEIETLLSQQVARRRDASPLPDLADLQGILQGQVEVSGSRKSGIAVNFNLQGQNFDWGPYSINQLVADGRFADGVLELQPLRFQSGESLVAFTGQVGGAQQSAQLRAENVPVEVVQDFVELPVALVGQLDATATLAGNLTNPQVQGELALEQATLDRTPVQAARGNFSYTDARLNFDSTVVVSAPEPVQITGSIPYQLPFASKPPESNQLSLDLNVQNEGLALLNVLTDQIDWVNGKGRADLQVRGTLDQPLVDGVVTVADATLRSKALSDPLTNVTSTIRFNRDRLRVEGLTGRFSEGQVVAAGVIPIFAGSPPITPDEGRPLTVNLNDLVLQLEQLYTGGVDGTVVLTGAVREPEIGGMVRLSDGRVSLGTQAAASSATSGGAATPVAESEEAPGIAPLRFNNLRVALGNNVQVTRAPILNFVASGDLLVNGSTGNIRPQGVIRFQRGQVNLFTTQFRMDPRETNYAQFQPNQGLDPNLSVNLVTRATEVTGTFRQANAQGINDSVPTGTIGALEPVRIEATVTGRASRLLTDFENNVELTSSPSRDREQIIALLGGSIDSTGEGESTLALANLASSAFLNNLQGLFDNALGNRVNFRLFPTLIPTESEDSNLNLGAEVGYDVTRKASVSILQVLTAPENPTQFGARYQLSDKVNLRGSVNLEGDSAAAVEYRTRF